MSNQSDISRAAAALGSRKTEAKAAAARANGAKGGRPKTGTPQWAGEYRGSEYWGFLGLRGYWNATAGSAVHCLPSRANAADVPALSPAEVAALEAAAAAAGK